jgi:MoxR-like ATPase
VYTDESVKEYILDLVAATRDNPNVEYGASPRAALAFLNTSKARAAINGRDYVIPDDVKALIEPIMTHRIVLNTDASLSDVSVDEVLTEIADTVEPPGSDEVATTQTAASNQ